MYAMITLKILITVTTIIIMITIITIIIIITFITIIIRIIIIVKNWWLKIGMINIKVCFYFKLCEADERDGIVDNEKKGEVLAPCPHNHPCPRYHHDTVPCNFSVKYRYISLY